MAQAKLLIITYVFPPVGGVMVQRALSFARYLPRHGITVHVLTTWNPATPVRDPSLLAQVPTGVTVHHAFTPEPPFYLRKKLWTRVAGAKTNDRASGTRQFDLGIKAWVRKAVQRWLCPDAQVLWVPFAIRRAGAIIRKHHIDHVLVTAPPFSLFLVGNALKKRFPNIRLFSDFRDEWLRFMLTDFEFLAGDFTRRRAEQLERQTVELSDFVIAVTSSSLNEIRGHYQEQPRGKFLFVPNGYDAAVFEGFTPRPHGQKKVIVTHVGTAYKTSSPAYYLDALDAMPEEIRAGMETRFIGRIVETELDVVQRRRSQVRLLGFLPQSQAISYMEETDYLLLTMTNDFSLPGKLFEYLATGKPILALSPSGGEVARLLEETKAGWTADYSSPAAVQEMLTHAYRLARSREQIWAPRREAVRRYERQRIAAELAGQMLGNSSRR